jgi:hypothetical protein
MVSNTIVRKGVWVRIPHPAPTVGGDRKHDVVPHVRPQSVIDSALAASSAGMRDADNARLHGVAVKTIRRWRRLYQRRGQVRGQQHLAPPCPRCDDGRLDPAAYSELLGWYLGDGYISKGRREVYNLHIYNDKAYEQLNADILELMRSVKPGSRPHTRLVPGCVVSTVSWKHWPCLFPQHGPGRKHERAIVLEEWQEEIVTAFPADFCVGCFRAPPDRAGPGRRKGEEIEEGRRRSERSDERREPSRNPSPCFCASQLGLVEVAWRQSGPWTISVSRREAVAALDELIGPKS